MLFLMQIIVQDKIEIGICYGTCLGEFLQVCILLLLYLSYSW